LFSWAIALRPWELTNENAPVVLANTYFDKKARTWDDDPRKVLRAQKVAAHIRKRVPLNSSMRALEYGCGTGLLSFALKKELGEITLADTSKEMLRVLAEKIQRAQLKNMTPLHLDLTEGTACAHKFDFIYSLMVLHHVTDLHGIFAALKNLLHEGGYLCIADLDKEDGSFHGNGFEGHNGFDRDELRGLIAASGFGDIHYDDCFVFRKRHQGELRDYSIFLMSCRLAR
jgi:2-polyprenyl-3-methyl-5-hydroxy-6-metoxy-1,4-benzoquinol methylase